MPRVKQGKGTRKPPPGLVLCRCKTRCLKFNIERGVYEGSGEHVTPKTRSFYRRDERLVELLRGARRAMDPAVDPTAELQQLLGDNSIDRDEEVPQSQWERILEIHLNVLRDMPVGRSGESELVFTNNPKEYGPYDFEYSEDAVDGLSRPFSTPFPNTGAHSLVQGPPATTATSRRRARYGTYAVRWNHSGKLTRHASCI